jgi:radical SAM superfamily enzyme YgiQ (UPF0313 family)
MNDILLTTLNARYIHSSLGLRYLYANMEELRERTRIIEFVINQRPIEIAEQLLSNNPTIIGLGIYIWNLEQTREVIAILRRVRPDLKIVIGGPEASYEQDTLPFYNEVDYIISGQADLAFPELCRRLLSGENVSEKCLDPEPFKLADLHMPYPYYTDEDIRNRVIYVEASRGCPFKCEFCLSALDKTAWPFELDSFLEQMDRLYQRGARHFKFVDRTFNLKIASSLRIMEFFLERLDENLFLHFELIPDQLPEQLKDMIQRFPDNSLQFEIGIQSFSPIVQERISRRQNNVKAEQNIRFLREETHAHLHTDLIMGLPGEDMDSIAQGFDRLISLDPHEIQIGILKRLRGAPIIRHSDEFALCFNPYPPYNILSTRDIDFATMQRLTRFARYWDMIGNSGRFNRTRPLLLGDSPFERFLNLSDWLYATTGQTHKIALPRLFRLVYQGALELLSPHEDELYNSMREDYINSGMKREPEFDTNLHKLTTSRRTGLSARQARHH